MAEDPKISQRYRELPREEPPRALDDKILAASRRAVESRPAPLVVPTGRRRWYFPVAAAAVIVLSVAVVAHMDRERPDTELVTPSAQVLETPPPPPPAAAEPRRDEAPRVAQKPARDQFTPDPQANSGGRADVARAPAAAPAPAAAASMGEERREADELRAAKQAAENQVARARAQAAPAPHAPVATTASALARVAPSPEQWLQGIADLRRQGRHEEADRELAEFRKQYPNYRLSDEMKTKIERR